MARVLERESLAEVVKTRLIELHDARKFKQSAIADRLGVTPSAVNRYIRSDTPITLDLLEAVSEVTQVPIAELVAPEGSTVKQLDAVEAALLRYLRRWPKSVARSLVEFCAFFADEPPAETQARNVHELYRRMTLKQREMLYACAVLVEGGSPPPPELIRSLFAKLSTDSKAAAGTPKERDEP